MEYKDSYIYALSNLVNFVAVTHGFDADIKALHDAIKLLVSYQKQHPNNLLISGELREYILHKTNGSL